MGFIKNESIAFRRWSFNLSHDHLDYHPTFAEYRDVKIFFDNLPNAFVLTNDDKKWCCNVTKYSG
jgi:UDP-N-acetylmuramoylalanine-D-glutamate ligase